MEETLPGLTFVLVGNPGPEHVGRHFHGESFGNPAEIDLDAGASEADCMAIAVDQNIAVIDE